MNPAIVAGIDLAARGGDEFRCYDYGLGVALSHPWPCRRCVGRQRGVLPSPAALYRSDQTMRRMTGFTTYGELRGCCGHAHRTEETAEICRRRDIFGCFRQGEYSDRKVYDLATAPLAVVGALAFEKERAAARLAAKKAARKGK